MTRYGSYFRLLKERDEGICILYTTTASRTSWALDALCPKSWSLNRNTARDRPCQILAHPTEKGFQTPAGKTSLKWEGHGSHRGFNSKNKTPTYIYVHTHTHTFVHVCVAMRLVNILTTAGCHTQCSSKALASQELWQLQEMSATNWLQLKELLYKLSW